MLDDKVKILDWKNAKLASATLDLAFLMLSSTTSDVRQTCTNDLLKSYHKVFCETLEKFGVSTEEQPSFAEIMEDYQISLQAAILQVSTTREFMGETFQAAQLTNEIFLTIDHSC